MDNSHAVREMRRAKLELSINVATGELLDIERVTSSSERVATRSRVRTCYDWMSNQDVT